MRPVRGRIILPQPSRREAALCLVDELQPASEPCIDDNLTLRCCAFTVHQMVHGEDQGFQSDKLQQWLAAQTLPSREDF